VNDEISIALEVVDPLLAQLLTRAVRPSESLSNGTQITISDSLRCDESVVLVTPTHAACLRARDFQARHRHVSLLSRNRLAELELVLAGHARGLSICDREVKALASEGPGLDPIHASVLECVMAGLTIEVIARRHHVSVATAKRMLALIKRACAARTRDELIQIGLGLGYRPTVLSSFD
jgi:hypothetical protein